MRFGSWLRRLSAVAACGLGVAVSLVGAAPAVAAVWSVQDSGVTTQGLKGVSCVDTTSCFAVGAPTGAGSAQILHSTDGGATWEVQNSSVSGEQLSAISCPSATTCVTVAATGAILYTTDANTSTPTWSSWTGNTQILFGVSCWDATHCVAVGNAGTILYNTSAGFTSWAVGTVAGGTPTVYRVSCPAAAPGTCFGVGDTNAGTGETTIITSTDGGMTWSTPFSSAPTSDALLGVSCVDAVHCVAVGNGGTTIVTNDGFADWTAQTLAGGPQMIGVSCMTATSCLAVGAAGTIASYDGTTWSTQTAPSGDATNLSAVAFPSSTYASYAEAVGDSGTILGFGCTGGSLGITSPSSLAFAGLALDGRDQTTSAALTITPDDETGSNAGWSASAYATPFADPSGDTLPSPIITSATSSPTSGTCSLPASSVRYPTASLGTSAATATKVYDSAAGTGSGPANVSLTLTIPVPANQMLQTSAPDTFSSTLTFTVSSGP